MAARLTISLFLDIEIRAGVGPFFTSSSQEPSAPVEELAPPVEIRPLRPVARTDGLTSAVLRINELMKDQRVWLGVR